jgi:hypothetical protein
MTISAASPPEEPPGDNSGLPGYVVSPQSGLSVSPYMILWGITVFATMTAPSFSRMVTMTAVSAAGLKERPT